MSIDEIRNDINFFDNQIEKFEYLIELGKDNPGLSENDKNDQNLIIGCASKSWLMVESNNDNYSLKVDSEAHIVRGLLSILQIAVNEKNKNQILNLDGKEILKYIGIGNNITSQRMNGFISALNKLKKNII